MDVYLILFLVLFLFFIIGHVINLSKEADEDVLKSKSIEGGRSARNKLMTSSTSVSNRQKTVSGDFIHDENLGSFSGHSGHSDGGNSSGSSGSSGSSCHGGD